MDGEISVTLKINRFDPGTQAAAWWAELQLEAGPVDRVLDLLVRVKATRTAR